MKFSKYIIFALLITVSSSSLVAQVIGDSPFSVDSSRAVVPACENISSDIDGDGWGWENNESCHVGSSFEYQTHVACEFSSSDSDGDGWGWENNKSCKVDSSVLNENPNNKLDNLTNESINFDGVINLSKVRSNSGFAYVLSEDFGVTSDSGSNNRASTLRLFEDEVELGEAHTLHKDIRNYGEGRYSHYSGKLYFSASDNTDPRENGRVYSYLLGESAGVERINTVVPPAIELAVSSTAPVRENCDSNSLQSRVDTLLESPDRLGFGAETTGGAEAQEITWVTNTNDSGTGSLRNAIAQTPPVWVAFDESLKNQTININSALHVNNGNITIDGRGESGPLNITIRLVGSPHGILMWEGNVILEGIKVDGNNSTATGVMARRGEHFWIDHLTVTNFSKDDALSISMNSHLNSANYVTVSNYHVHNTNKGLLAGGEPNVHGLKRYITVFKSQFSAFERNPTIYRGYQGHIFNNYMHNFTYGMHVSCKGIANVENNIYSGGTNSLNAGINRFCVGTVDDATGTAYSTGNIYIDGARESGPGIVSSSVMNIPYGYQLMDTNDVKDYVLRNSGSENAPGVCE